MRRWMLIVIASACAASARGAYGQPSAAYDYRFDWIGKCANVQNSTGTIPLDPGTFVKLATAQEHKVVQCQGENDQNLKIMIGTTQTKPAEVVFRGHNGHVQPLVIRGFVFLVGTRPYAQTSSGTAGSEGSEMLVWPNYQFSDGIGDLFVLIAGSEPMTVTLDSGAIEYVSAGSFAKVKAGVMTIHVVSEDAGVLASVNSVKKRYACKP